MVARALQSARAGQGAPASPDALGARVRGSSICVLGLSVRRLPFALLVAALNFLGRFLLVCLRNGRQPLALSGSAPFGLAGRRACGSMFVRMHVRLYVFARVRACSYTLLMAMIYIP